MSVKERRRLVVFGQVRCGQLSVAGAGRALGVSERQVRRLWRRYQLEGDGGLVHRLRGRAGNRRSAPSLRSRAVALYQEHYGDFGATLAAEHLASDHGLGVDDQTLRRWLVQEGLWRRRRRDKPRRRRRERRSCLGELVQMDGSDHDWFEGRGPRCCLMVMVDDATGWAHARFFASETTCAAMTVLREWGLQWGLPQTLYPDRHSIHRRNDARADEIAARTGRRPPTQLGRALEELGVKLIWAGSPQAKGRVERLNRTLQDRLVKGLRLAGISDLAWANAYLQREFLPGFNRRFAVRPADEADVHVKVSVEQLDRALVECETRVVGRDHCVLHRGRVLQLCVGGAANPPAGCEVRVETTLEGRTVVRWRGEAVRHRLLPQRPLRERSQPSLAERVKKHAPNHKPPPHHPWRRGGPLGEGVSATARAAPSPALRPPRPAA